MHSNELPNIEEVKKRYGIPFNQYNILMYHPVTTEITQVNEHVKFLVDEILKSKDNFVVIYPNNDVGSKIILKEYQRLKNKENIRIFPSMRFEYFLSLLRSADCMVGNSSSGIRETGIYGIPTVDIGSRQKGRYDSSKFSHILHVNDGDSIYDAINNAKKMNIEKSSYFGEGNSDKLFHDILCNFEIWDRDIQKQFIDVDF